MKASLKFRDDQKPLVRAKIPLSVLGFPFMSGISAGDAKELCLSLRTAFESGPAVKLSYRPKDSWNPFSLIIKTGIGPFGSPSSAPMAMSAEFSLLGRGKNPTFSLQFKPQIGDFSIRKTSGSTIAFQAEAPTFLGGKINGHDRDAETDEEGPLVDSPETPVENGGESFRPVNGTFSGKKANGVLLPDISAGGGQFDQFLSGVEVSARSVLPIRSSALLKFRWGVRFPAELRSAFLYGGGSNSAQISLRKIPLLVMNKISIEHVAGDSRKGSLTRGDHHLSGGIAEVADACSSVRRQLEALREENGLLRRVVEELRSDIGAGKSFSLAGGQDSGRHDRGARDGGKTAAGRRDRRGDSKGSESGSVNAVDGDVNDELKKALMAA
ncbi:hypothetical protein ACLOJK_021219 [Asimina triloba]